MPKIKWESDSQSKGVKVSGLARNVLRRALIVKTLHITYARPYKLPSAKPYIYPYIYPYIFRFSPPQFYAIAAHDIGNASAVALSSWGSDGRKQEF